MTALDDTETGTVVGAIRARLADDAIRLFVQLGWLANAVAVIRDLVRGASVLGPVGGFLAMSVVTCLHLLRGRIPAKVRIVAYLALLLGSAFLFTENLGVRAAGSVWFVVAVFQAWVLLGSRAAVATMAVASSLFALAAWRVVHHGALGVLPGEEFDRNPLYWGTMALNYVIVSILLFHSVRRLVDGVIEGELQAAADRDRVQGILEGIDDAVLLRTISDDRILDANRGARNLLQRSPTGEKISSLSVDGATWTPEAMDAQFAIAAASGLHQFVWRCRRSDGEGFWAEIVARRFEIAGREHLLVSIRDIGERIRLEADLEKLNRKLDAKVEIRTRELEAARQELASFSYSAAHDLRMPLRSMSGFAQALREDLEGKLIPEEARLIEEIVDEAKAMADRVDELLARRSAQGGSGDQD